MKLSKLLVNFLAAPIVLLLFFMIAFALIKSKEAPPVRPQQEVVINVAVSEVSPATVTPVIETFGTTQSYFSTSISSQVGGEIIEISPKFKVGSAVQKGDWLAKINPADFESALANRRAAYANSQTALAEEETRSLLAREDWLSAGRSLSEASDLTLRKPQLAAANAAVASAKAAVEQAELDLERTIIRSPFDAIVEERTASLGNVVSRGATLGSLLARERIQVRLPLTPKQASRIQLPKFGDDSTTLDATLTTPSVPNAKWAATINRVEPQIDPKNQSIFLVGEIENPFENPNAFLPVGAFVNAVISAPPTPNIYTFDESTVVNDSFVWVVSPENTLARQPIEIVFSQSGQILARIEEPLYPLPLRVLDLPLASLKSQQKVNAVLSTSE